MPFVFGTEASIYATLCYKEIWVPPKITLLPAGTPLSETLDLGKISARQVDRVVNETRRQSR